MIGRRTAEPADQAAHQPPILTDAGDVIARVCERRKDVCADGRLARSLPYVSEQPLQRSEVFELDQLRDHNATLCDSDLLTCEWAGLHARLAEGSAHRGRHSGCAIRVAVNADRVVLARTREAHGLSCRRGCIE